MTACPQCDSENPAGSRFCNSCGAQLAAAAYGAREERKVITCLFCDMVGFTARAERLDPEEVRALQSPYWQRVRAELERFGGTVEKYIGDAVVALFGAPVAHEDDPERAVRAALAVKEWAEEEQSLQVRIGITTGEALVTLGARPSEGEGMASGDVVNTAARLQSSAPANGIVVDEATYRATRERIDYREAEPVQAKGKAGPIAVFQALEATARLGSDRALADTPLVGREDEIDLLVRTLGRVKRERRAQLATLVGVPGIGKSRLVAELFGAIYDDPDLIHWRQGRSLPYGEGVAFWALAEIVKAQAGILEGDEASAVERKLDEAVTSLVPDGQDRRFVSRHLRPLVGLPSDAGTEGDEGTAAFAAWTRFLEALADLRPTVLVFEDLHWADDGLLDFVEHLLEWVDDVPLFVVATSRPELLERRPTWGGGKTNVTTMSVAPLSSEETARLVAAVLGRAVLRADTQQQLLERAGGNPLYAEQYARLLAERGNGDAPVPETVQAIIGARLDSLQRPEKALLHDAAVLGKVFWIGALRALNGLDENECATLLHALERKEFVRRERRPAVAGEQEFAFRHLLVRDVAYGQIPRAARSAKHEAAAVWIESLGRAEDRAEMLAHHYSQALEYARAGGTADPDLEERTRQALRAAGDRARSLNALPAAVRFYRAALELWPRDDAQRAYVLFDLGAALAQSEAARVTELEEARDSLLMQGDVDTAAEAETRCATSSLDQRAQRARLERALAMVADRPPSPSKAYVLSRIASFTASAGEAVWERYAEEALTIAEQFGRQDIVLFVLQASGTARGAAGDVEQAVEALERAIAAADAIDAIERVAARINLAALCQGRGELERAFRLQEEARPDAERFGLNGEVRHLRQERVLEGYWCGRWDDAARDADGVLADVESGTYHSVAEIGSRHARAHIRLARGDVAGALDDAERAVRTARASPGWGMLGWSLAGEARVRLALGDVQAATAAATEALEHWRTMGPSAMPYTSVDLAVVLAELSRGSELRDVISTSRHSSAWFEAAIAFVSGDHVRAADLYASIGSLPDEADARLRSGDDGHVRRALDFYRSVGAARYIGEGEALLAATA